MTIDKIDIFGGINENKGIDYTSDNYKSLHSYQLDIKGLNNRPPVQKQEIKSAKNSTKQSTVESSYTKKYVQDKEKISQDKITALESTINTKENLLSMKDKQIQNLEDSLKIANKKIENLETDLKKVKESNLNEFENLREKNANILLLEEQVNNLESVQLELCEHIKFVEGENNKLINHIKSKNLFPENMKDYHHRITEETHEFQTLLSCDMNQDDSIKQDYDT